MALVSNLFFGHARDQIFRVYFGELLLQTRYVLDIHPKFRLHGGTQDLAVVANILLWLSLYFKLDLLTLV